MGLALNLRQIVGQLLQLDVVGNGPQFKHNAGTMEMRNSMDTGFVITRGSDPVGNNDYVTKGAGDLAYWRSVNPNWLVTDWYIDGVTGDDTNSGTVIGSPIKTGAELLRRLGPYAMWPQSVTVHVLANGMTDALVLRGLMMVAGTHLDVVGTPTVVADAGTIATYVAVNHATPEATLITSTGIADWTAYVWKRVRVTAGARINNIVWVARSNPSSLGLATARTTVPLVLNQTSASAVTTSGTALVAGDAVVIESLPIIPSVAIQLDGPIDVTAGVQYSKRQYLVTDIDTPDLTVISASSEIINRGIVFGCRNSFAQIGNLPGTGATGFNCLYGSCLYKTDSVSLKVWLRLVNSLIGDGLTSVLPSLGTSFSNVLMQGVGYQSSAGLLQTIIGCQVFDIVGAAFSALTCNNAIVQNFSGSGNAGYGISVANNSAMRLVGTINIAGAVSNARLSNTPAINLTLPQLLQPADYAQKGITPAMVAGVTIVTVPWYDNTTQRVTVSHAAFAGTPGILSVQQISNTQFTITSSSALDTSTVNWTISPLGRNIFISTT
jgi:hypothetical protein